MGLFAKPKPAPTIEQKEAELAALRELRAGARDLLHPRVLAAQTALGAAYLVIAGTALFVTAHGIGQTGISYADALGIWFLTQAMAQILPIPIDIGVVEVSGVGALLAIGVEKNAAISIMLVNRVLSLGAALTIALIVTIVLREQFAVLRAHRLQGGA